jgi:predicted nucleic acid-binding protein
LEPFSLELPFELFYTPENIDKSRYPDIRDAMDSLILVSAIVENVDALISGDLDFTRLKIKRPEILTPKGFEDKYR